MPRNYNFIYSKLVENENDIVGHIAYSLYKTQKVRHIEEYKEKHDKEPEDQELVSFNEYTSSQFSLDAYRLQAGIILEKFIEEALKETITQLEADTIKNQADILRDIIKPITPPSWWQQFWSGLFQNVLAALVIAVLFTLLIMVLQTRDKGLEEVVEDTFRLEIEKKAPSGNKTNPDSTVVIPR